MTRDDPFALPEPAPDRDEGEVLPWVERRVPQMRRWVREVGRTCFGHDDWAVAAWYFVAGVAFRDAHIPRGAARINPAVHLLILAPPASGKSTLGDMVKATLEGCHWPNPLTGGEAQDTVKVNTPLDMTTAGALGGADAKKVKNEVTYVQTVGAMETYDAVMWDEAGSARSETAWNVNLLRGLNQVMDGRAIERDMKGIAVKSFPKAALWMTAPDDFGYDDQLLRTGFPQRILGFWSEPTPEQDAAVAESQARAAAAGPLDPAGMAACVEDFQRLFDYSDVVKRTRLDWSGVGGGFRGLTDRLTAMAKVRATDSKGGVDPSFRWMRSFVHRYKDTAYKLAGLNALARCALADAMPDTVKVTAVDFQVASGLVRVSAAQVFDFVVSKAWKYTLPRHVPVPQ